MTSPESRAQEGARKAFAEVMRCLDAGNPVGAEAMIWKALVHYAEPVEKERDELREEVAIDDKLLAERDALLDEFACPEHGRCVPGTRKRFNELREENTRLREQLDAARETNTRLQRRCQSAEAGLTAKLGGGSMLGRALANSAATMYRDQLQEAQAEIARLHRAGQLVDDTALEPRPPLRDEEKAE